MDGAVGEILLQQHADGTVTLVAAPDRAHIAAKYVMDPDLRYMKALGNCISVCGITNELVTLGDDGCTWDARKVG